MNEIQSIQKNQISPSILARKKIYAGIPDEDVALALAICQKYNLDPLLRHVVLIPGKVRDKNGNYVERYTPYITRDGLLHVAHCSGQFDGIEVTFGKDEIGEYAEAQVFRKDMKHPFKYRVYKKEYENGLGAWKTHPMSMLTKTAEVFALRRAFDVALTPVEEMGIEENEYYTIPVDIVKENENTEQKTAEQPIEQKAAESQEAKMISDNQKKIIHALINKYNMSREEYINILKENFNKESSKELTFTEASTLIDFLKNKYEKQQ